MIRIAIAGRLLRRRLLTRSEQQALWDLRTQALRAPADGTQPRPAE